MTLGRALEDPSRRAAVVADCVRLIEEEVAGKRGLSGAALRAGYAAFCKLRPGITAAAVERLLPPMTGALDRHWTLASSTGDPAGWFRIHAGEVADDLLAVTDGLADRAKNRVMVRIYRSLRGSARDHVVAAVPRLPPVIARHSAPAG